MLTNNLTNGQMNNSSSCFFFFFFFQLWVWGAGSPLPLALSLPAPLNSRKAAEKKCFINGCEKCCGATGVLLRGTTEPPARVFTCYYDKRGLIITQGALGTVVIKEKLPVSAAARAQPLVLVLGSNSLNTCVGRLGHWQWRRRKLIFIKEEQLFVH